MKQAISQGVSQALINSLESINRTDQSQSCYLCRINPGSQSMWRKFITNPRFLGRSRKFMCSSQGEKRGKYFWFDFIFKYVYHVCVTCQKQVLDSLVLELLADVSLSCELLPSPTAVYNSFLSSPPPVLKGEQNRCEAVRSRSGWWVGGGCPGGGWELFPDLPWLCELVAVTKVSGSDDHQKTFLSQCCFPGHV